LNESLERVYTFTDKDTYIAYADGAVSNNGKVRENEESFGGIGIVFTDSEEKRILLQRYAGFAEKGTYGKIITNNRMELEAVINAIKFFVIYSKASNNKAIKLIIKSDSEYVVKVSYSLKDYESKKDPQMDKAVEILKAKE
jgi:ribonuclease HI